MLKGWNTIVIIIIFKWLFRPCGPVMWLRFSAHVLTDSTVFCFFCFFFVLRFTKSIDANRTVIFSISLLSPLAVKKQNLFCDVLLTTVHDLPARTEVFNLF